MFGSKEKDRINKHLEYLDTGKAEAERIIEEAKLLGFRNDGKMYVYFCEYRYKTRIYYEVGGDPDMENGFYGTSRSFENFRLRLLEHSHSIALASKSKEEK